MIERPRVTVVLLTYNCAHRLTPILDELTALGVPIVAVDNASSDDTLAVLRRCPGIGVIALERNIGAAARNIGLDRASTPYVAFCDDDGYYEASGLQKAVDAMDLYPELALVNARILVGEDEVLDPISAEMADSPLPDVAGVPGAVLLGFMAGACVVRVSAYCEVGGYDPRYFIGGEEEHLALRFAAAGWQMRYLPEVVMHHLPSRANAPALRSHGLRNALWTRWMYRPALSALRSSAALVVERSGHPGLMRGFAMALRGLPWVLRDRRPVPRQLDRQLRQLDRHRRQHAPRHREHARRSQARAAQGDPHGAQGVDVVTARHSSLRRD